MFLQWSENENLFQLLCNEDNHAAIASCVLNVSLLEDGRTKAFIVDTFCVESVSTNYRSVSTEKSAGANQKQSFFLTKCS